MAQLLGNATISVDAPGRVDGVGKVTGRERYTADFTPPGCLIGKTLRSPYAHARIVRVDASRAMKLPGVRAVLTGQDVAGQLIGRIMHDMPILAFDRVRFIGEKVAAVAAIDADAADEALALIDVEYEELPAVYDPLEAMQPGAPLLHPDVRSYRGAPATLPDLPNVQSRIFKAKGDLEQGFAESDRIFEHLFTTPTVHQGYLEPHSCVVQAQGGKVHIWASNKGPFKIRDQVAELAGVPPSDVLYHTGSVGGDFGGKGSFMDIPLCFVLSRASEQPVKMIMSYVEEMMAGNPRHASVVRMRTGVKADGRLWARDYQIIYNGGAYAAFKPVPHVNLNGVMQGGGPYRIPHVRLEGICVYTNITPGGHFRSPGEAQTIFAVESATDMIAADMGIDRLAFRKLNAMVQGDANAEGRILEDVRIMDVLDAAVQASGWHEPRPGPYVGRGIGLFNRNVAEGQSVARVSLTNEGLTLSLALPDVGVGTYRSLREVVARTMGVPAKRIQVQVVDTDGTQPDPGVGATRVTVLAGGAALDATQEVKTTFLNRLGEVYGWDPASTSIENGVIQAPDGTSLDFFEAARGIVESTGDQIEAIGSRASDHNHHPTVATAQIAEVEVDPETGQVTLRRFTTAHDVGTILNPVSHQGQIEGAVVQGIGYALLEETRIQEGRVETVNLGDYKLPNEMDVPPLTTVLVPGGQGPGPFELKPIGESGLSGVSAAIANAVYDAVGVRITSLPITAEKVRAALRERQAQANSS